MKKIGLIVFALIASTLVVVAGTNAVFTFAALPGYLLIAGGFGLLLIIRFFLDPLQALSVAVRAPSPLKSALRYAHRPRKIEAWLTRCEHSPGVC